MRTTLTLDDEVAAKLKAEARRTSRPFKHVVNDCLRRGLMLSGEGGHRVPFKIVTQDLGMLQPGISLDNIAELLEIVEGPSHS